MAFVVNKFRQLGLKPGNGDSYLQQVPLAEITGGRDASLAVSGQGGALSLDYAKDMVIWTKREATESAVRASQVVFLGYGIVAPEYSWDDYAHVDVHGKTVVVLTGDPGSATKDPKAFKGRRRDLLRAMVLQGGGGGPARRRRSSADSRRRAPWACPGTW